MKCGRIQRLGVLLVAAHGPRTYQRRFGFAILDHFDCPAFIVVVLDHPCRPAIVAPQAWLVYSAILVVGGIVLHGVIIHCIVIHQVYLLGLFRVHIIVAFRLADASVSDRWGWQISGKSG